MEKTEAGLLKIVSGIVGSSCNEQIIEPFADTDLADWITAKTENLSRKGFVMAQETDYTLLFIRFAMIDFGTENDFKIKARFEQLLDLLLYTKGLGFRKGGFLKQGYWELACFVLDAPKAKELIRYMVRNTSFEGIEVYELPSEK